jgi:hypothetical protein
MKLTVFDKDRAIGFVKGTGENNRWFRTPSFVKTARYCAALMRDMGLADKVYGGGPPGGSLL